MGRRHILPAPIIQGDVALIPMTKGYFAKVDIADLPLVAGNFWTAKEHRRADGSLRGLYAYRKEATADGRVRNVYLHRTILSVPEDMFVDHVDRDGLNNTRANLRPANASQNQWNKGLQRNNTSGAKGVKRHRKRWGAEILVHGRKINLGRFDTVEQAAAAHREAARRLHGEFARTA